MVKLMNHYVQLVEADNKLMESLYWRAGAPKVEATKKVMKPLPQTNQIKACLFAGFIQFRLMEVVLVSDSWLGSRAA